MKSMAAKVPHKIGTILGVGFSCILIISTVVIGISFWKLEHIVGLSTQIAQPHAPINIASDRSENSINGAEAALDVFQHELLQSDIDEVHSRMSEFSQLTPMLLLLAYSCPLVFQFILLIESLVQ